MLKIEIFEFVKKGNFMNKLFINLLLILGINFSLLGSNNDTSERQRIYEQENEIFEGKKSVKSRIEKWKKQIEETANAFFAGSFVVQNNKGVLFFDTREFKIYDLNQAYDLNQVVDENTSVVIFILHTKYNLNRDHPDYQNRLNEAIAYAQRVDEYDRLTKEERLEQMRKDLKRNKHDRSQGHQGLAQPCPKV